MQFVRYYDDGTVQLYHTMPHLSGTPDFECTTRISLSDGHDSNGSLLYTCPKCGTGVLVPLAGGTDAQRLHAHARLHDDKHPAQTLADAIESVIVDVAASGGLPSVELGLEGLKAVDDKPDEATQPALFELAGLLEAAKQTPET